MILHDHINMASTTQQELHGQSLDRDFLGERETHPNTIMAASEKEAPRFESLPPEIRNMIYKNLFQPVERCKKLKLHQFVSYWDPQNQYSYVFHTSILRSNRLIGQEANYVLYGSLVLINFDIPGYGAGDLLIKMMLQNVAFNHIAKGTRLPPHVIQISHVMQYSEGTRVSIIVAAADVQLVCEEILGPYLCPGRQLGGSYFLVALPQLDKPYEPLLKKTWLPLKALRETGCLKIEGLDYGSLQVIDSTGVFEKSDRKSDWEKESKQESNTKSECERDNEENESGGSGSEGTESDKYDSDNDDVEEDGKGDTGRAFTNSDEIDSDEHYGDEHDKAEDKSEEAASNKFYGNDPAEKMAHGAASTSGHNGDANTAVFVKDKSVAGGRSDDELGHKVHNQSNGDNEGEIDKRGDEDE